MPSDETETQETETRDEPLVRLGPRGTEYERQYFGEFKGSKAHSKAQQQSATLRNTIQVLQARSSKVLSRAGEVGHLIQHAGPVSAHKAAQETMTALEQCAEATAAVLEMLDQGYDSPRKRKGGASGH